MMRNVRKNKRVLIKIKLIQFSSMTNQRDKAINELVSHGHSMQGEFCNSKCVFATDQLSNTHKKTIVLPSAKHFDHCVQ